MLSSAEVACACLPTELKPFERARLLSHGCRQPRFSPDRIPLGKPRPCNPLLPRLQVEVQTPTGERDVAVCFVSDPSQTLPTSVPPTSRYLPRFFTEVAIVALSKGKARLGVKACRTRHLFAVARNGRGGNHPLRSFQTHNIFVAAGLGKSLLWLESFATVSSTRSLSIFAQRVLNVMDNYVVESLCRQYNGTSCTGNFNQVPGAAPRRGSIPWRKRAILTVVGATPVCSFRAGGDIPRENKHPVQDRDGCCCDRSLCDRLRRCVCCFGCSVAYPFGQVKADKVRSVIGSPGTRRADGNAAT